MNFRPTFTPIASALLLASLSISAQAQSNVTVFGVMDAAVRQTSNTGVATNRSVASGANSTSRLGFRGTEDLGSGMAASFHLEHGLALDSGSAASSTQFWDRRATVSLSSKTLGEVRLGRDFVPTYVNWGRYDPFSYVGVASASILVANSQTGPIRAAFSTNPNTTVRANSGVQYLLPNNLGGLEGGVMLAPSGGGTLANGANKVIGARLGWANKTFGVAAAATTTENSLTTVGKFKDVNVGGFYDFSVVRLTAAWRRFDYDTSSQTNWLVGATMPLGSGTLKFSWNQASLDGKVGATTLPDNGARVLGLGYVYDFSKRTAAYATVSQVSNDSKSTFVAPGGTSGMAAGGSSRGLEFGVRHNF